MADLTREANILFASDSVFDILGFQPEEVIGRSCFDYFHPDEVPMAKKIHNRDVQMDKAAVLHYARIQSRDGQWIGCECVFTVVYEVMVACTSVYRGDAKNEREFTDDTPDTYTENYEQVEQWKLQPFDASSHHLQETLDITC